ncbi:hypothetical protein [Rhodomicrobium lacus]|nr:hypothetical protein [Rhodomicrobium lacus]WKW50930.1 hypothetical protein QMO75_00075 [Rhodomicrobium lacus]
MSCLYGGCVFRAVQGRDLTGTASITLYGLKTPVTIHRNWDPKPSTII